MKVNVGDMRERFAFWKRAYAGRNTMGQDVYIPMLGPTMAGFMDAVQPGLEYSESDHVEARRKVTVTVRFCAATKVVDTTWFMVDRSGAQYEIESVDPSSLRSEFLEFVGISTLKTPLPPVIVATTPDGEDFWRVVLNEDHGLVGGEWVTFFGVPEIDPLVDAFLVTGILGPRAFDVGIPYRNQVWPGSPMKVVSEPARRAAITEGADNDLWIVDTASTAGLVNGSAVTFQGVPSVNPLTDFLAVLSVESDTEFWVSTLLPAELWPSPTWKQVA